MPKYDDLGRNELDSPDDAWRRADILLDAHHKLAETYHHPNDIPSYAIERLITDLMHYAHECNKGKAVDSGECVDFDHVVADAKQQFIKEREAAVELHEPLLDPNRPQPDPKFDDMQNKMYSHQLAERNELHRKQEAELKNQGPSQALSQRHDQELTKLTEKFQDERERRTREYQEARRIREELEKDERTKALGLDHTPEEGEEHG
jgi:hypothetical protein